MDSPAVGLPRLGGGRERERLARAGLADDHRDAVSVLRQPPHHLDLLVSERRTPLEHPLERPWHRDAHSRTAAFERVVDDPPLEREQVWRRVDPLDLGGRDGAAVSPAQHFDTLAALSRGEHHGARRAQEGVREPLDVGRRDVRRLRGSARRTSAARRGA